MELEELAELMRTRRSIRKWEQRDVPDELIEKALSIATWAPSGGNYQSWRFIIIKNRKIIEQIADAVLRIAEMLSSWEEAKEFHEEVQKWLKSCTYFKNAPVCIAVLTGKYTNIADKILAKRGEKDPVAKEIIEARRLGSSRLQSIGSVVSHLLLVLHKMGLGAVWMTGPLQAKKEIEKIINCPADMDFVTFIPVGYPAETPSAKTRKSLKEIIGYIK